MLSWYLSAKHDRVSEHQYLPESNKQIMRNFHPFEVVGHVSEAQLQVGENIIKMTWWVKG